MMAVFALRVRRLPSMGSRHSLPGEVLRRPQRNRCRARPRADCTGARGYIQPDHREPQTTGNGPVRTHGVRDLGDDAGATAPGVRLPAHRRRRARARATAHCRFAGSPSRPLPRPDPLSPILETDTGTHDLAKKVFQAAFTGKPRNRRDDDASHRPEEPRTNRHRQRAAMHAASARNVLHT
jgi:hypothetical protein